MSLAVDRNVLASEGEAGLANPVLNATGLTLPTFSAWSAPVANMTVSATGNAAAAEQVLQKAGYTKGSNGFFQRAGRPSRSPSSPRPPTRTCLRSTPSLLRS